MSRIWQEFYCNKCNGYIDVKLNIAINHEVEVVCPNCKRPHRRCIKDGVIYELGRFQNDAKERITPVSSAYHKEPKTIKMQQGTSRRDGVTVESARDMVGELWQERFGGK